MTLPAARRPGLRPAFLLLAASGLFLAMAAWLADPLWERAFRSDNSPVAWLSGAQLWALAVLCLRLGSERALPQGLASCLAMAMAALALDEQFGFHEEWKYGCTAWFAACRQPWVRELPMLLVGIGGLAAMALLHRRIAAPPVRFLLWAGVGVGLGAIAIDQLPVPAAIAIFEEGFEVLAESLFLGGLLALERPSA